MTSTMLVAQTSWEPIWAQTQGTISIAWNYVNQVCKEKNMKNDKLGSN